MAFWSGNKLALEIPRREIVEDFHAEQVDCSAYTLTLGEEFFVTPDYEAPIRKSKKQTLAASKRWDQSISEIQRVEGGPMIIPPGQFAFLLTEEFLRIPDNVMGFISLKSSAKWRGLINVSGFHVDPGFQGRLIYSVYNAGPSPIQLNRGQDLFLLWLADLDDSAKDNYAKKQSRPLLEIPSTMISEVNRQIHSLQALSDRIEALATRVTIISSVAAILAVVAGLAFAVIQLLPVKSSSSTAAVLSTFAPHAAPPIAPAPTASAPAKRLPAAQVQQPNESK
jgi:dCTP deaminase